MMCRLILLIHSHGCLRARLFLLPLLLLIPNLYATSNIDSFFLKNNGAFAGFLLTWPFLKHPDSLHAPEPLTLTGISAGTDGLTHDSLSLSPYDAGLAEAGYVRTSINPQAAFDDDTEATQWQTITQRADINTEEPESVLAHVHSSVVQGATRLVLALEQPLAENSQILILNALVQAMSQLYYALHVFYGQGSINDATTSRTEPTGNDSLFYRMEAGGTEPLPLTFAFNSDNARLAEIESSFRALSQDLDRIPRLRALDRNELISFNISIKAMAQYEFENDIDHQSDISHQIEWQLFKAWLQDINNRYPHEELTRLLPLLNAIDLNSLANVKIRQVSDTPSGSASGGTPPAGASGTGASGGMSSSNSGSGSDNQRGQTNNNSDDQDDSDGNGEDDPDKTLSDPNGDSPRICVNCDKPLAPAPDGASGPLTTYPENVFNERFCPECQEAHRDFRHHLNQVSLSALRPVADNDEAREQEQEEHVTFTERWKLRKLSDSEKKQLKEEQPQRLEQRRKNFENEQQRWLNERSDILRKAPDATIRAISRALYNAYGYLSTVIAGREYPLQIDLEQYHSIVRIEGLKKLETLSQEKKATLVDRIMLHLVHMVMTHCATRIEIEDQGIFPNLKSLADATPNEGEGEFPFSVRLCASKESDEHIDSIGSVDIRKKTQAALIIVIDDSHLFVNFEHLKML